MIPLKVVAVAVVFALALAALVPLLPDPWFAAMIGAGALGVVMLRQHNAYLARKRRAWQEVGENLAAHAAAPQH